MRLSIGADDRGSLFVCQEIDPLKRLQVKLDPEPLIRRVDEAVGVGAVAVHMTVRLGDAAVGEEHRDLVEALRGEGPEVPHGGRVAEVGLWIAFLGVDEVGELVGIAHEEDGGVVANEVPVPLLGVELHCEATHVALCIGGAPLPRHRGEPEETRRLLADIGEEIRLRVLGDVAGHGERTVGARAFRMHDALRNPFAVEVGVLLEELPVLDEEGAPRPGREAVLIVANGDARSRRDSRLVYHRASSFLPKACRDAACVCCLTCKTTHALRYTPRAKMRFRHGASHALNCDRRPHPHAALC